MSKQVKLLSIVFVLLLGLTGYVVHTKTADHDPADDEAGLPEIPELDIASIVTLEIKRPDEEPVRFEKQGDTWTLTALVQAAVDESQITTALTKPVSWSWNAW